MGCDKANFGRRGKRLKRPKFGFQFCPQGFRLAAPHGTLTRGGLELNSRRQILSQGPSNFLQVMLNHCLNLT